MVFPRKRLEIFSKWHRNIDLAICKKTQREKEKNAHNKAEIKIDRPLT